MMHSPLGGSAAERFIECPGSVSLVQAGVLQPDGSTVPMQDDEDDTYSGPGTTAHALAALCLEGGSEPWQHIGKRQFDGGAEVDKEMADAVADYIATLDRWHPANTRNQGNTFIERRFECPDIHKLFFGTSDFIHIDGDGVLHVWDFKYGAGVVVEPEHNAQLMYYAAGAMEDLGLWSHIDLVRVHIFQPRAWHSDGPHRSWKTTTDDLVTWLDETLLPAMERALTDETTKTGEHCRFCPVRFYGCPALMKDADELEGLMDEAKKKGVPALANAEVCRILDLGRTFLIQKKAALSTATARAEQGVELPGWKLAKKRSNREFRAEAATEAFKKWGDRAMTKPTLKSPAQIEKLPGGKDFNAEFAFKPDTGTTLVPDTDTREKVTKEKASKVFKDERKR